MARRISGDAAVAAATLGTGLLFVMVGKSLSDQWHSAESHGQGMSFEHMLGFVASSAGAAIVAWWMLSLALAIAAAVLHRAGLGKGAASLSKFSPAFMLRVITAVMGLSILASGPAQASIAAPDPGWRPTSARSVETNKTAWTATPLGQQTSATDQPGANEQPGTNEQPTDGAGTASSRAVNPGWRPTAPVVDPGLLSRQAPRQAPSANEGVVVKAGDSLWTIAASRLGPIATDMDVALAWPKWYAANRATIGNDPSVLLPGQVLQPPSPG